MIFLDETPDQVWGRLWTKTNMTRLRGRSRHGARLIGSTHTVIGRPPPSSPARNTIYSWRPWVLDSAINGRAFLGQVDQDLVRDSLEILGQSATRRPA
ncbi:MAG: hypothetical protein ABI224_12655 [Acetobacteraceae bacterium]